jgi:hypothetical protein
VPLIIVRILSANEVIESRLDIVRQRWSQHNQHASRLVAISHADCLFSLLDNAPLPDFD